MARKFYQQTTGNDQLRKLEKFLDAKHLFGVVVGCRATAPVEPVQNGKPAPPHDAVTNLAAYRKQAKGGRDPVFLDDTEIAYGNDLWGRAMDFAQQGNLPSFRTIGKKLAEYFVGCIRKHIDEQRGKAGSFIPPASERYKAIKKWKYGNDATKTLYASGQLYDSFYGDIDF